MRAKKNIHPDDDESYSAFMSPTDETTLFAAQTALDAWLTLPPSTRESHHSACETLFSAAFGLLSNAESCAFLVDYGAQSSLDIDDAHSFARFVEMGASLSPAVLVQSVHHAYSDSWEGSLLHYCTRKRLWRCATYLASLPIARHDMELCEPVLRQPEPCILREYTSEKIMEMEAGRVIKNGGDAKAVRRSLKAVKPTSDLIAAIFDAHLSSSETLSMTIAVSSVLRGNPFFVALSRLCDTERCEKSNTVHLVDPHARSCIQALIELGLFKLDSSVHREALLGLCSPHHNFASQTAAALGLTPEMGSTAAQNELLDLVAARGHLSSADPFVVFLGSWAQRPEFLPELWSRAGQVLRHAVSEVARAKSDHASKTWAFDRAATALSGLITASTSPQTGLSFDATAAMRGLRETLDGVLLEHADVLAGKPCYDTVRELSRSLGRASLPRSVTKKL